MSKSDNVRVTGMAWVTALGDDLDAVWSRLLAGETGMREVPYPAQIRNLLAAPVPSVPLELPPAERVQRMALDAAQRALGMSGRSSAAESLLIAGTSFGSYLEDDPPAETAHA